MFFYKVFSCWRRLTSLLRKQYMIAIKAPSNPCRKWATIAESSSVLLLLGSGVMMCSQWARPRRGRRTRVAFTAFLTDEYNYIFTRYVTIVYYTLLSFSKSNSGYLLINILAENAQNGFFHHYSNPFKHTEEDRSSAKVISIITSALS